MQTFDHFEDLNEIACLNIDPLSDALNKTLLPEAGPATLAFQAALNNRQTPVIQVQFANTLFSNIRLSAETLKRAKRELPLGKGLNREPSFSMGVYHRRHPQISDLTERFAYLGRFNVTEMPAPLLVSALGTLSTANPEIFYNSNPGPREFFRKLATHLLSKL